MHITVNVEINIELEETEIQKYFFEKTDINNDQLKVLYDSVKDIKKFSYAYFTYQNIPCGIYPGESFETFSERIYKNSNYY